MSPASFAVSSAPSPELMAATTRTWRSASPKQIVPRSPPKKRQERWHKNHFRPDKSAIADTLTATVTRTRLAAPSADLHLWGVGGGKRYWAALSWRGHRVPPREWSRGESGGVGGGRGQTRSVLGRISVGFRKRARRRVIIRERRPVALRPFACACAFKRSEM